MRKQIIFVADDFGLNAGVNAAILHAYQAGALQGAALMMGQPGTEEAVAMARDHPALEIGWHLHLNDSLPLTISRWPWGASPARAGLAISFFRRTRSLLQDEVAKQWELFQKTGLPCRFVNCHHHLHAHPEVFRVLQEALGHAFPGWIRLGRIGYFEPAAPVFNTARIIDARFRRERKLSTWPSPDTLWGLDRLFAMNAHEIRRVLDLLPEGFHEFLFHPRTLSCPDTQCLLELRQPSTG